MGRVLFIIAALGEKAISGIENSVWKIFLFTSCILNGKLYNELKREPFVKFEFYKRQFFDEEDS